MCILLSDYLMINNILIFKLSQFREWQYCLIQADGILPLKHSCGPSGSFVNIYYYLLLSITIITVNVIDLFTVTILSYCQFRNHNLFDYYRVDIETLYKHIFLQTDSASRRERCCQSPVRGEASRMAKAYIGRRPAGGRSPEGGREGIAGEREQANLYQMVGGQRHPLPQGEGICGNKMPPLPQGEALSLPLPNTDCLTHRKTERQKQ